MNHNLTEPGFTPEGKQPTGTPAAGDYGEDAVLDLIASEGLEKKSRSGALVIVGVVVLAAAGLFSMHTLTKVHAGDKSDPATTRTVDEFLNSIAAANPDERDPHQRAIQIIGTDYTDRQVATSQVGNPFSVGESTGSSGPAPTGNLEEDIRTAAKELNVQMVLLGSRPTALINKKTAHVGDVIEVRKIQFKVVGMSDGAVTVLADYPEQDVRVELTVYMKGRQ